MIRRLLQRLRYGRPRPCGDPACVAGPEDHGAEEVVYYDGFGAPIIIVKEDQS